MAEEIDLGLVDFETGDQSQWSGSTVSSGLIFVASAEAIIHGNYGGLITFDGLARVAYFYKTLASNQTVLYARAYFDIATWSNATAAGIILSIRQGTTVLCSLYKTGTGMNFIYRNDVGLQSVPIVHTWSGHTCLEIMWTADTGSDNGAAACWIDDVLKADITGINNDTQVYCNRGECGYRGDFSYPSAGDKIHTDDFKMSNSKIGLYIENKPTILTISDNTIINGQTGIILIGTKILV